MDIGVISFVIFVAAMAAILYLKRSQLEFQGIIALTRTKKFKNRIYSIGENYSGFWKIYFKIGIVIGGLVLILGTIYMVSITTEVFSGTATPAFGLVVPYPTSEISYSSGFLKVPIWLWVIAIPFILIPHELSHGLALAANKLRIKSLGLLVLLVIPGAFVEPDEKQLKKAGKIQKLQVYCAGSFSNIVTGLLLVLFTFLFLAIFYQPAGIYFGLPLAALNQSEIISNSTLQNGLIEFHTSNATYLTTSELLKEQQNKTQFVVFEDLPAARNEITGGQIYGTLKRIGDVKTNSPEDVKIALSKYNPGDTVRVETSNGTFDLLLSDKNGTAYMGVLLSQPKIIVSVLAPENARPYEARFASFEPVSNFILQILNFTIAVCIGVAIFNMLPMKPLDGGAMLETLTNSMTANIASIGIFLLLLANFAIAIFG
jgi:membrane-associated protease RseP (regulator of RpoE activity)